MKGISGCQRFFPEKPDIRITIALGLPLRIGCNFCEKYIADFLIDPCFPTQIRYRAATLDYVLNRCTQCPIIDLSGRNHAIAVEFQARDELLDVGHIRKGDLRRIRLAETFQYVLRRSKQLSTLFTAIFYIG